MLPSFKQLCNGRQHQLSQTHGVGRAVADGRSVRVARPLAAVNNQHSHIEEELQHMQQLLVAPEKAQPKKEQHVFYDTDGHPYQRQSHRRVYHEHAAGGTNLQADAEIADAVELSYQYSSNIVNYRSESSSDTYHQHDQYQPAMPAGLPATPLHRPVYRVRVEDYSHPSVLAREIVTVLYSGAKLQLELPDEPAAVSSLLTAVGRAASKLQSVGLATALDPLYDPAAVVHGCSTFRHSTGSTTGGNHHSGAQTGSHSAAGGSPSACHDATAASSAAHSVQRRASDGCHFVFCARAVPIPPAAATMAYTVGSSMGQQVLRVGPSTGVHALLPALLQAILRDGLVTVRCCWFDEESSSDSWSDDELDTPAAAAANGQQTTNQSQQWHRHAGADGSQQQQPVTNPPALSSIDQQLPAGSLVHVPCVLRAIFKLDRQLRGLDLGGLVLLPHSFMRAGSGGSTQVLHLDVVIA